MTRPTGIRCVRWHTSPTCARYLEYLECKGDESPDILAVKLHNQEKYAYNICLLLKASGIIHVHWWRHNSMGKCTPIYRLGPGRNKPQPKPQTASVRARNRRDSLRRLYGAHAANVILGTAYKPGRISIDGRTMRPGDHDAQLAGKIS